ncbi:MAG TPA: putative glycoside hydrolase [Terriglobales bacterium]|nr:putative glycoside hydrolase [Terriglobales bacterium]
MSLPWLRARFSCLVVNRGFFRDILMLGRVVSLSTALAAVQNPHAAHLIQTTSAKSASVKNTSVQSATAKQVQSPVIIAAPPGSELYIAQRGDSIPSVARKYLRRTKYLTSSELGDAIRSANANRQGAFLKPGEQILIPGILESPIIEKSVPVARDFEVRAVYLTGVMAGSDHGARIIRHWKEVGGNAVVFDIKDSDGIVNIAFDHGFATGQKHYISDLPKFVRFLHSQNMHAIARVAIFRDEHLVTTHPELAVHSHRTGGPWRENGKLVWTDPSNRKVQDYDIALAKFVAQQGVDEVQFDYVRFPAEGDQKDATFNFQAEHPDWQRSTVIAEFLKRAYAEIHPTGVLLSLDVFGVMAWQRPVDLAHTGQDIVAMAKHCDVLSPMIYPSHFFGMDGYEKPGDAPEHFIGESMDRFKLITKDSGVVIRPWLQAFAWRTKTYSPKYVEVQVATAKQKGGIGFLFWNANNDYSKPYAAMPEMRAAKGEYFRGDEVGVKTEAAATGAVSTAPSAGGNAAPGKSSTGGSADSASADGHKTPTIWRH